MTLSLCNPAVRGQHTNSSSTHGGSIIIFRSNSSVSHDSHHWVNCTCKISIPMKCQYQRIWCTPLWCLLSGDSIVIIPSTPQWSNPQQVLRGHCTIFSPSSLRLSGTCLSWKVSSSAPSVMSPWGVLAILFLFNYLLHCLQFFPFSAVSHWLLPLLLLHWEHP